MPLAGTSKTGSGELSGRWVCVCEAVGIVEVAVGKKNSL